MSSYRVKAPGSSAFVDYPWTIEIPVLLRVNETTTDKRRLLDDAVTIRTPPLPIMVMPAARPGEGHVGAEHIGALVEVRIERRGRRTWLWGGGYLNPPLWFFGGASVNGWYPAADCDSVTIERSTRGVLRMPTWTLVAVTLHPGGVPMAWPDIPEVIIKERNQE